MTRAAIPTVALIVWLLSPQTAHCFYNPSTGNYVMQGGCQVLGCKYWTCNLGLPRGTPSAYSSGSCGGWTYNVGGPVEANYHAKAMEGVIEYLSCEHGQYVKRELSAGSLQQGFYYSPPEAWSGGERLYP
jgi:hypothetical protein